MSERTAKRLRRETKLRGDKPKMLFKALTIEIKGVETYIPRKIRRKLMRRLATDIRKGRLNDRLANEE